MVKFTQVQTKEMVLTVFKDYFVSEIEAVSSGNKFVVGFKYRDTMLKALG